MNIEKEFLAEEAGINLDEEIYKQENRDTTNKESWEIEFRKLFKKSLPDNGYEGSYMLNCPYEEVIHYISKTIEEHEIKIIKEYEKLLKNNK